MTDGPDRTKGVAEELPDSVPTDVWCRTSSKYRIRSTLLLLVNIVLFAGVGCFAYWLRTGNLFAFTHEGYWGTLADTFMPRGYATLANFVQFPIRIDIIPIQAVVVGLLLAAMASVPILIAMLYRFPCCIPFVLIIAFMAVMPWMAISVLGACIVVSVRPLRFRFRYASALLGLVLVLLYFYGASRQTSSLIDWYKPEDRIKFMAPMVLAFIAACVITGSVLLLAKLVNYRPGVVAPLLVVCFAVPVAIFEKHVGRDELYYRLLEKRFHDKFLLQEHYVDHDVSDWFERVVYQAWLAKPEPRPPFEVAREVTEFRLSLELDAETATRTVFAEECDDLLQECNHFIKYFPDSRYASNVMYMRGQTLDMRIDLSAFRDRKVIRYYDDFPSKRSEVSWRKVVHTAPDERIAAVGRYKLALLAARDCRLGEAIVLLDELISKFDAQRPQLPSGSAADANVLDPAPADVNLKIPVEQIVFEAKQLLAMLLENGDDPLCGPRPFCGSMPDEPRQVGLMQLDPRHGRYLDNLRGILKAWPHSLLVDNIYLLLAKSANTVDERTAKLEQCLENHPDGDAAVEARFRLGVAYFDAGTPERAQQVWEELVREAPDDRLWKPLAEERLRSLGTAAEAP